MSDSEDSGPEVLLKIVFVGDSGVGKTSLIERMFSDRFDSSMPATIGTDQRFKRLNIDGKEIGVSVWDTAGQDRFSSLTPFYYRGAAGVVYVYDVTRADSLQHLRDKWMEDYKQYHTVEDAVQMVVGNKVDLGESLREVSPEEGAAFAREHGCLYKETSAKTDSGGTDAGVYDALVWGMVCTILDMRPSLLPPLVYSIVYSVSNRHTRGLRAIGYIQGPAPDWFASSAARARAQPGGPLASCRAQPAQSAPLRSPVARGSRLSSVLPAAPCYERRPLCMALGP